jgi:mannose-1-phosphate guanylyltransferase
MRASEPELVASLEELAAVWDTPEREAVRARIWPDLVKIAIDYSVAEPAAAAGRLAVIPGHFSWYDVGDFATVARLNSFGGRRELAVLGSSDRVRAIDSTGLVITDGHRVVSVLGLENVVVVDTADALLVTTADRAQEVKALVEELGRTGLKEVL